MSLSDPIANLLTNIRNAVHARKETVDIPASKLGQKILEIFKSDGYLEDFRLIKDNKQGILKVYLKYTKNRKSAIVGLKRVSKPGLRVYAKNDNLPPGHQRFRNSGYLNLQRYYDRPRSA